MILNEQLATLVCVAEQGSFGKAADKLFISAPAVIKQMNSLENKLGLKLFNRTNPGVTLTPAAKQKFLQQDLIRLWKKQDNQYNKTVVLFALAVPFLSLVNLSLNFGIG